MKIWTVANQKGGVGKTTTVVSLASLLAAGGKNTLMIDLDPHGSLTSYFSLNPDQQEHSIYTLFQHVTAQTKVPLASLVKKTPYDHLYLLPASTAMFSLDKQLGAREGMGLVLARALKRWSKVFDYVLLDCPPTLGILMINALAACDLVLVPVQTEFLALRGLERIMHTFHMVKRNRKFIFEPLVIPTMFDYTTRSSLESLQWLFDHYDKYLWNGIIPKDEQFSDASSLGQPLSIMAPDSPGAVAYSILLDHLQEVKEKEMHYQEAG